MQNKTLFSGDSSIFVKRLYCDSSHNLDVQIRTN